jgi:hypothetical protein
MYTHIYIHVCIYEEWDCMEGEMAPKTLRKMCHSWVVNVCECVLFSCKLCLKGCLMSVDLVFMCVSVCALTCVCMYACVCVCVRMYAYIYIYTYIYT